MAKSEEDVGNGKKKEFLSIKETWIMQCQNTWGTVNHLSRGIDAH